MQIFYNTVCCEQRENCKYNIDGHCHGIPYNIVLKSINKLKTEKNDGYEGLPSDYFRLMSLLIKRRSSQLIEHLRNT